MKNCPQKTYRVNPVRPYAAMNTPVGVLVANVQSGRVFLNDLPEVGSFVTIRWHGDGMIFASTHQVIDVDAEKTGEMTLLTHWKGWTRQ